MWRHLSALLLIALGVGGSPIEQTIRLPGHEFLDAFARNKMFPLAAAAYSDDPQLCLTNSFQDAKMVGIVFAKCQNSNFSTLCSGYVAVSPADKAVIVSFRGTNNFLQLVTEVGNVAFFNRHRAPTNGMVAQYFYDVFEQLWYGGIEKLVNKAITSNPEFDVWLTGHSLGGAVASITATKVMVDYKLPTARVKLITFGQPRTGDNVFSKTFPDIVPTSYRVNHKHDVVPHVPPRGYVGYNHHFTEVWYPSKMTDGAKFKICEGEESPKCSNSVLLPVSVLDHITYYNEFVPVFGIRGCKWSKRK
ncbi:unnamed protein product [Bursaphelenchus xylophilus]|uniref:(pine wood nematode) hypothetical protein n=1 Tax=Bursaphelenchus xylophilus TaxID=6326 RepID=A0A1I7S545_BURXY|nr:unnamed protein product [Bursaphelenchus xylophilus]CAG9117691.1 unnamed protein product [Bursaphelenchus xylophilus]